MQNVKLILVIIAAILFCSGCDRKDHSKKSGKSVKIGVIAPLSGSEKEWGKSGILGVKTVLGLQPVLANGDSPVLIVEDDQNKPELTRQKMKKLVEEDNVSVVLLFSDSDAVLHAISDVERYKTPVLVFLSTHPAVTDNNWVSQIVIDDFVQAKVSALYVRDELLIEHVGVLKNNENQHSVLLAEEFVRIFEEAGGKVEQVDITGAETDMKNVITDLAGKDIDFLYLPLDAEQVINVKRATRELDWFPGAMVSDGLLSIISLQYKDDLDLVDGMLATEVYSTGLPETEYWKTVSHNFKKMFGQKGTTFTALGCEGTSILIMAMDRCENSSDRYCINRMLRRTENFSGLVGRVQIRKNGKTERPIFINTIKNKELKFVVKIY